MSFLARVSYTANGSVDTFTISFPYILTSHVKAFVDGVEDTNITFPTSSTIQLSSTPASGAVVQIRRVTPSNARLVDFQDGSVLTSSDLDQSADQNFFVSQETKDDVGAKLGLDTADRFDALNKRIINLADPVNDQDAVNKRFISTNIPNITTVAGIASDVTTVASNNANVTTVATNIGSVNTVANDITKVIAVANDLAEAVSEVETVADDLNEATSEIDTVANSITNVDNVGNNIANVNTVATNISNINAVNSNATNINAVNANSSNINTVAGQNANITTLAGISSDVTTVAGIASDVTTVRNINLAVANVSAIANDVTAVNGNSANINTVANNSTNINTVAGISSDVTSVAGIASNVTTVANDTTNIGTIVSNISNINTVAGANSNITTVANDISNVNTVASNNANVTTVAGSISSVNTVANNIGSINNFNARYRIELSDPTTNNDEGDLVYNQTEDRLKFYNGSTSSWETITTVSASSIGDLSDVDTTGVTTGQVLKYDGTNFTASDDEGSAFLKEQVKTISTNTTITTDNTKYQFLYAPLTIANGATLTVTGNGSLDFVNYNNFINI